VTSFSHFYLDIVLTLTINYIAICVRSDWNCPFTALNASHTQIPTANANSIIWRLLLKRHPPSVRMNLDYKRKAIHIIHSLSCLRHWSQLPRMRKLFAAFLLPSVPCTMAFVLSKERRKQRRRHGNSLPNWMLSHALCQITTHTIYK